MNWLKKILERMAHPRYRVVIPAYGIEGSTKDGYSAWACAGTREEAMEMYLEFGGDPEKITTDEKIR